VPASNSPCCLLLTSASGPLIDKLAPAEWSPQWTADVAFLPQVHSPRARSILDDSPPPNARHGGAPSSDRAPPSV
jgi:hypothetical protein